MTSQEFTTLWNTKFPEAYPIPHELKWIYPNRWFRTHSFPDGKRYADNEHDYQIISQRQNVLMESLFGEGTELVIIFGFYSDKIDPPLAEERGQMGDADFVGTMDLGKLRPEHFDEDSFMHLFIKKDTWDQHKYDAMLFEVADNAYSVMFYDVTKHCLVAPYDGGVDVIMASKEERGLRQEEFKRWGSEREDGM